MLNRLHLEEMSPPILRFGPQSLHMEGRIKLNLELYEDSKELCRTIDHEIAHYIHYAKNSNLRKPRRSLNLVPNLLWVLSGKVNKTLAEDAFREGFATYIESITCSSLKQNMLKAIEVVENGNRWKLALMLLTASRRMPYALGYLVYSNIAKIQSETDAISVGLSATALEWLSKGNI